MKKNNFIQQIVMFGIFIVAGLSMYLYTLYSRNELRKAGVYSIGYISETTPAKNGIIYTFKYGYKSDSLKYTFSAMGFGYKEGHLLFVEFLPENPKICNVMYEVKVPSCLSLNSIPADGWWKKLPLDSCK